MAKSRARPPKDGHECLQAFRGVVNAFSRIDVFNLNDTAFPAPNSIDSVNSVSAVVNEPRHDLLSHSSRPFPSQRPVVAVVMLRCYGVEAL